MRTKILEKEKLLLQEDGLIYKLDEDLKPVKLVPVHILKNREHSYPYVSTYINGGQKSFLANRLIAKAFIPNPNDYPYVEIINGDPKNLSVENLRWIGKKERNEKMLETTQKNLIACKSCGHTYSKRLSECPKCLFEKKREKEKELNRQIKLQKIKNRYKDVIFDELRPEHQEVLVMRLSGKTYQEIGDEMDLSRERIRQMLQETKTDRGKKDGKYSGKIRRYEDKIKKLEMELKRLKEEGVEH